MPSGNITITPARVLSNETLTLDKLNDLGNPSAQVDEGAITSRELADEAFEGDKFQDKSIAVGKLAPAATNTQHLVTRGGAAAWEEEVVPTAYPVRADSTGAQAITADGTRVKLTLGNRLFDPKERYDNALSRFTAPVHGIYQVSLITQFDNDSADPATMQISVFVYRNGATVAVAIGSTEAVPSPVGARWFPKVSGLIELAANEYIEAGVEAVCTGAGVIQASNSNLSIHLVQELT